MIPKIIFTIWLSNTPGFPPLIEKCIESQREMCKKFHYQHRLITLSDDFYQSPYFQECVAAKKWAKAADYLRIQLLHDHGGIYLDADVEMLPDKNFDDMLGFDLFTSNEENNFVSNAIIGSVSGHKLLQKYLQTVQSNFIGSGDLIFQPGMYLWTELVWQDVNQGVFGGKTAVFRSEYFLPYNHHVDQLRLTNNSRCIHHFSKSWLTKTS